MVVVAMTCSPCEFYRHARVQRTAVPPATAKINWPCQVNGDSARACRQALSKPARQPCNRFAHVVGRTRIGEADEAPAVERIEIDARSRRHMRLLQHPLGKLEAVRGKIEYLSVEVKSAVCREKLGETGFWQALDQDTAVFQITALDRFHLLIAVEGGFGRDLRQRRH